MEYGVATGADVHANPHIAHTGDRQFIMLGGRPVATTSTDPRAVNRLQASSTIGMPAVDLLGSIVSSDPTGVVVVQQGVEGVAFALDEGRVIGAFGTGPRGSMQAWSQAAITQEIEQAMSGASSAGVGLARLFIERCVLEHLPMATEVGSVVSVLRGDVRWTGTMLDASHAPRLQHLLMEFARESDDCKAIERRLHPLSRLVVPISPPLQSADDLPASGGDDEADFGGLDEGDEEDPNELLWAVWRMCNVDSSIDAIAEASVFGRAPTLRALNELRRRKCIELVDGNQATMMAIPDLHTLQRHAAGRETIPHYQHDEAEAIEAMEPEWPPKRRRSRVIAVAVVLGCLGLGGAFWLGMNTGGTSPPEPTKASATAPAASPKADQPRPAHRRGEVRRRGTMANPPLPPLPDER